MLTSSEATKPEPVVPRKEILALSAAPEQTIYVSAFRDRGTRIPAFATRAAGTFFTEGFSWHYADAALHVRFVLSPDIARIRASHAALTCRPSSHGTQDMIIPASEATYDFDVEFACGGLYDPKIIISPVPPGG